MADPADIEVQCELHDDAMILRPQGEIDLSRSPALRHHLSEAQRDKPGRLIIDLHDVPYMDSSGVATLVEAMQTARRQGSQLVL